MANTKSNLSNSKTNIESILLKHYSLKALNITELVPFDGRNYSVEVAPQSYCMTKVCENDGASRNKESPHTAANSEHSTEEATTEPGSTKLQSQTQNLILKIFREQLCTDEELAKIQQKIVCSQYLREHGFLCPDVILTNKGELIAPAYSDRYTMLMTRLPGQMMGEHRTLLTPTVLFELGYLLASMHQVLQGFDGRHLEPDSTDPWCLENMHLLIHYIHYIKDVGERRMLSGFISTFQKVREKFHFLQKGVIHGDFHDLNLIVDWSMAADSTTESPSSPSPLTQPICQTTLLSAFPAKAQCSAVIQKYGIIDFEDMTYSYPALELSRLIADMMIECKVVDLLDIGGHVLAGYLAVSNTIVRQFHFSLYETALTCLVQYILLGLHEIQLLGKTSEYWLEAVEESKEVLGKLQEMDASEVYKVWADILDQYGLQNPFIQQ